MGRLKAANVQMHVTASQGQCTECQTGEGPFQHCVFAESGEEKEIIGGSCANCYYEDGCSENQCNLRKPSQSEVNINDELDAHLTSAEQTLESMKTPDLARTPQVFDDSRKSVRFEAGPKSPEEGIRMVKVEIHQVSGGCLVPSRRTIFEPTSYRRSSNGFFDPEPAPGSKRLQPNYPIGLGLNVKKTRYPVTPMVPLTPQFGLPTKKERKRNLHLPSHRGLMLDGVGEDEDYEIDMERDTYSSPSQSQWRACPSFSPFRGLVESSKNHVNLRLGWVRRSMTGRSRG